MQCAIGQMYMTSDLCLCEYYVISDILISLIVSYNITTIPIDKGSNIFFNTVIYYVVLCTWWLQV